MVTRPLFRAGLGVGLLAALLGQAPAQDRRPARPAAEAARDDYRQFLRNPQTVEDFWQALQFELDVGGYELAARWLRGLMERNPTDEQLLKLEERDGTTAFLRLRLVPKWSDDPKVQAQAVKDANDLADRLGTALQRVLGDPKRIQRLVRNLTGEPEEQRYAAKEIFRARAAAVPHLIAELRQAKGDERDAILSLLPRLSSDTLPPLLAALDIPDNALRLDLIEVLIKRGDPAAVPYLWYFAGSAEVPERLRQKATEALAHLLRRPAESLPSPVVALTQEADRYYRHEVRFPNPDKVGVWRWDGKELVSGWPGAPTVPAGKAEEYYGLRFARQALEIDPTYTPAQVVFLSLALERGVEQAGLDQPLAKGAPEVQALLTRVNADLIARVLDRALNDRRVAVVLGAVRALGELADPRALRPVGRGEAPLVRALNFPDRRVQLAAAEALLRLPAVPPPAVSARVVDVLRRAAAMEPGASARARVLVGFADDAQAAAVARAVQAAGFDPITVNTGREALRRLAGAADVDALLISADLPDPGLAPLVAQLRAGVDSGLLPLWLVLPSGTQDILLDRRRQIDQDLRALRTQRQGLLLARGRAEQDLANSRSVSVITKVRADLERLNQELTALAERENSLLASRRQIELDLLGAPPDRGPAVRRLAERYPNVWVIGDARDPAALKAMLTAAQADAAGRPLSEAERKQHAERALRWLARIARGEVPGYDFRPAEDALYRALQATGLSDDAVRAALEAVGRLPGARPQTELANVTLDPKRPAPVRTAAAQQLLRHIQAVGLALSAAQVQALEALGGQDKLDADLRAAVALVLGSTRPNARVTGERLKEYRPQPPAAPKKVD